MAEFSFQRMLECDRLAEMLHEEVREVADGDLGLIGELGAYAEAYARFNRLSEAEVSGHYQSFASEFIRDLKAFDQDGRYPFQRGKAHHSTDRVRYDIALIFSALFTAHRYRLMQLVSLHFPAHSPKACCVGCGPGIELMLVKGRAEGFEGYDLSLNPFCRHAHPDVAFFERPFECEGEGGLDAILAIELLEHVPEPYGLLRIAHRALREGGTLLVTTATDIPQFDHLYNFPADGAHFEECCKGIGFRIVHKVLVPHRYAFSRASACNSFYVLVKRR